VSSCTPTPAERARTRAGYSLQDAARKLNLSKRYLRQIERHGNAPLKTARRLARLYNCSGDVFIHTPRYFEQLGQGMATEPSYAPATAGVDTRKSSHRRFSRASRRYNSPKTPTSVLATPADE